MIAEGLPNFPGQSAAPRGLRGAQTQFGRAMEELSRARNGPFNPDRFSDESAGDSESAVPPVDTQ